MDKSIEQWVDAGAVAEHLGYRRSWVYKQLPLIPHVKLGKSYRFKLSVVDEWFTSFMEGDY